MKKIIFPVILTVIFVSGCVSSESFKGTTITGDEIVFASDRDSTGNELYLINDDGTDIRQLTLNDLEDNNPAFSRDKKKIAFHRALDSADYRSYEIYIMDLETGEETRVTNNNQLDGHPDWSPDGKSLVFARFNGSYSDLFTIDLETGEETQLMNTPLVDENDPEWSPEGTMIAFKSTLVTNESGREEIYIMDADGSNIRRLTTTERWQSDHDPSWSSDSEYIYFERFEGIVPWYQIQNTYYFLVNFENLIPWNLYRVDLKGEVGKITNCSYICWLPVQYGDRIMFLKDDFGIINETLVSIKVDYKTIMPDGTEEAALFQDDDFAYKKAYFDF